MEASNTNQQTSFQSAAQQPENKLHFLDYWRIIRIRKTVILAVFLLVVITTTAVTFMLPESYVATARIEVAKDIADISPLMPTMQSSSYDPYFLQTEFEKIKSQKVLHKVISNLNLIDKWTKRYQSEVKLKLSETYALLKRQVDVQQARNTSLIEIRAYSDVPEEAASIANEIVDVYTNLRKDSKLEASGRGIKALEEELLKHSAQVDRTERRVGNFRRGGT
jgi:polysaccharide biosynthesis transport protein